MGLHDWAESGWLKPHKTSRQEVAGLLGIVERDLGDAGRGISADWRFGIACNAALRLCTILLYAEGYRPERNLQHYRKKRNIIEYDAAGTVTDRDATELVGFAVGLRDRVLVWLSEHHAELRGS